MINVECCSHFLWIQLVQIWVVSSAKILLNCVVEYMDLILILKGSKIASWAYKSWMTYWYTYSWSTSFYWNECTVWIYNQISFQFSLVYVIFLWFLHILKYSLLLYKLLLCIMPLYLKIQLSLINLIKLCVWISS